MHAHWASDLKLDYDDPTSTAVGSELVCSSITTGGDGADSGTGSHPWLKWNPHLRFQNNLRGYVNTTITRESLVADFRAPRPSRTRGARLHPGSFTIEDRKPGLNLTAETPPTAALRAAAVDTVAWETERP